MMAAWHEPPKPGVPSAFWFGVAWALYLSAMLGLIGWILYRVLTPLP